MVGHGGQVALAVQHLARPRLLPAGITLGDELAVARCDLDLCNSYKNSVFNFALHRQPEQYRMIVERKGAVPPPA